MVLADHVGVWNEERVNIDSSARDRLALEDGDVESGGSSISPNLPCGAMNSAIDCNGYPCR